MQIKLKFQKVLILLFIALGLCGASFKPAVNSTQSSRPGWHLIWRDEFDSNKLDPRKWRKEDAALSKNNELQYYCPEDVIVKEGMLILRSRQAEKGGRHYCSGLVETKGKFSQKYGRIEIRSKVPKGKGLLPAAWMLPASGLWPPEIDIMEVLGHMPNVVHMTVHWGVWPDRKSQGNIYIGPDFSEDFHTYAIEWDENSIKWFVDDIKRSEVSEYVPHEPFFIIINTAVGGDWPGKPNSQTKFPQYHLIDYVRVYAKEVPGFYYLTSLAENGKVEVNPGKDIYPGGSTAELFAKAYIDYEFSHWSGDLSGSQNPASITFDTHKNITANFKPAKNPIPLISKNKKTMSSSDESDRLLPEYAVDGDPQTRWSSQFSDPQWIQLDLGKKSRIKAIRLTWEVAFAKEYEIQVSDDAKIWKTIYATKHGPGSVDEITGLDAEARYLRVYGKKRGTEFGYSLWELEVFGNKP
jgi:beta-glucanase (GH16 family)